MLGNALAIAHN